MSAPAVTFDPGYGDDPWRSLVEAYPGTDVYPASDFRVEWGPLFHRGRLDGSARVLVIGQDPAEHEAIARRILIGEAGQRVQGFLAKLGLTTSYVMVNTYLYSIYGQSAGNAHIHDAGIASYRNSWIDALVLGRQVQAVVAFGGLADASYQAWAATQPAAAAGIAYQHVMHPTAPISGSGGDPVKLAELTKIMLTGWNAAIEALRPVVTADAAHAPLYLSSGHLRASDDVEIPSADMPAGLPAWMRSLENWASRTGSSADTKRATIEVVVPADQRPWS
jgi:uracil DNA glycosylase superfamily protein